MAGYKKPTKKGFPSLMNERPRHVSEVEINPVADGYVLYQPSRDRVHFLNATAVVVYELCTGKHTADEIAAMVQQAYELAATPTAEVAACLDNLRQEGLVA